MKTLSTGLLPYRFKDGYIEVFLVHPGGPFYEGKDEGVWRLEDLFQLGEALNQQKRDQLKEAHEAIEQLVSQRRLSLSINLPFGWEELQFA